MSLLNYLQFQEIESEDVPETHRSSGDISLDGSIDESSLENFWEKVNQDIHDDPEWFDFAED